ncbi:hypothetical protein V8E54_001488 [Elaphomyces granulatus]
MTSLDRTSDPSINKHDFTNNDYTVGRICALDIELAASQAMLDELRLLRSFPKIRFGLMVGVGGGASGHPSDDPIRLGDVVVSNPKSGHGGVVHYDFGKAVGEGKFIKTRSLDKPPPVLRSAVLKLRARHESSNTKVSNLISCLTPITAIGTAEEAVKAATGGFRDTSDPIIHYGLIGSANQDLWTISHCYTVICDYADTHKNKYWQPYAAAVAAAYGKELLEIIPPAQVDTRYN